MPVWAYVLILVFLFGIGFELAEIDSLLRKILKELKKSK
jgi:hypothetical protein